MSKLYCFSLILLACFVVNSAHWSLHVVNSPYKDKYSIGANRTNKGALLLTRNLVTHCLAWLVRYKYLELNVQFVVTFVRKIFMSFLFSIFIPYLHKKIFKSSKYLLIEAAVWSCSTFDPKAAKHFDGYY